jgi:hypothetical protein
MRGASATQKGIDEDDEIAPVSADNSRIDNVRSRRVEAKASNED